jgi:hypothetical protein
MGAKTRVKKTPYNDPDVAFRQLDDESQYKYLLLDSPMAEALFAAEFLDLELDPFQVFSLRLLRGRFASEEELWSFIYDNEMEWMFENGWIRHGNKEGVSPSYFKSYADGGGPNVLVLWPGGFGKLLSLDTPLPTPNGWTTMGSVQVGDQLVDEQGAPCTVTYKSPVSYDHPCYAVKSGNNEPVIAGGEHLWSVKLDKRKPAKVHDTEWLYKRQTGNRPIIDTAKSFRLPDASLPLDPYVFGVWLGDGASAAPCVTEGTQDAQELIDNIRALGYDVGDARETHGKACTFYIRGIIGILRSLGVLGDKHIPMAYLRASTRQRTALLQGIVDTDGYVNHDGLVEVVSMRKDLAEQIAELVRTLGAKASIYTGEARIGEKSYGTKYRVFFHHPDAARLKRRRSLCWEGQQKEHYISVEEAGEYDAQCLQVDSPSHLFLAGRAMIPTHNTTTVTSKVMPIMEVCDNPNARIQYIGKTDKESDKFSVAQRHVLMQPKLVKVFGQFQPEDKGVPWANYAYSVRQRQHADISENAEFYGSNSDAALGRRSDRVVIDDIETFVTARTPEQRAKLLEWVQTGPMTSARPMWGTDKHGKVLIPKRLKWSETARYWGTSVVGTIFHPEGLYAMLMRNPNFTCVKFDCFRDRKCTVSLSEKIMSADALHAKRVTTLQTVFNKRYRNIAYDESEMAFREAWVRGQDELVNGVTVSHPGCLDKERSFEQFGQDWDIYLGFDPASGSTSRWSAYAAYVVLGIDRKDEEKRIYLIDYLKLQDQFDRMLDWLLKGDPKYGIPGFYAKYAYKQGVVEKNAFGKWMLTNDRVAPYVKTNVIVPSYTGNNKSDPESGVFAMGNLFQNGRFRIPYKEPSDQAKAELFIADLLLYPKGTNDLVMAMWLAQIPMRMGLNTLKSWFTPGGRGKMVANPAWQR